MISLEAHLSNFRFHMHGNGRAIIPLCSFEQINDSIFIVDLDTMRRLYCELV